MEPSELLEIISRGEDGSHQFKATAHNVTSLAEEFCALSNSGGGYVFLGVADDGTIAGLSQQDIVRINQLVSNAASQHVRPAINPRTENVKTSEGLVMVIQVADGFSKPYMDNSGAIFVKSGADKRKVTAREEMQRIFQAVGLVHADEIPVSGMSAADLDLDYFSAFFEKVFGQTLAEQNLPLVQLLENMNLMRDAQLNLSAALLFARDPQRRLPLFVVKAIAYPGDTPDASEFLESRDIKGRLADVFAESLSFLLRQLRFQQNEVDVNGLGEPEIPRIVLEELLANALIHRDYFVSGAVRLFVYSDRVEIVSPGHLPNNLTVENIRRGNSNIRNPILASFATRLLPYRGLGNGISRAIRLYPQINFLDDRAGSQFTVSIARKNIDD